MRSKLHLWNPAVCNKVFADWALWIRKLGLKSVACRNECRPEDIVLLTKETMHWESGARLDPPALHILALAEKVETSHERKGEKLVTAHVNLISGAPGKASAFGPLSHGGYC